MDSKVRKNKKYLKQNINNSKAHFALRGELTEKESRQRALNDDTQTRLQIQTFIRKMHDDNKNREEILAKLKEKYGGFQYLKYQIYFESWVDNVLNNKPKAIKNVPIWELDKVKPSNSENTFLESRLQNEHDER